MKKYLSFFFFIILFITFLNKNAQASNINDVLSSLSDVLYNLKNILSADIYNDKDRYIGPGYICNTTTHQCYPSPFMYMNGKTLEECMAICGTPSNTSSKPEITNEQRKCTSDYNCQIIETDCCGCNYGGDFKTKQSINKTYASQFSQTLNSYCSTNKLNICPTLYQC